MDDQILSQHAVEQAAATASAASATGGNEMNSTSAQPMSVESEEFLQRLKNILISADPRSIPRVQWNGSTANAARKGVSGPPPKKPRVALFTAGNNMNGETKTIKVEKMGIASTSMSDEEGEEVSVSGKAKDDEDDEDGEDDAEEEDDDGEYRPSGNKKKQKNSRKGSLRSAIFSNIQSKSGRTVKQRQTADDEEEEDGGEDEDEEYITDDSESDGSGSGRRNKKKSNRPLELKQRSVQ
jgi:hypothetical protein